MKSIFFIPLLLFTINLSVHAQLDSINWKNKIAPHPRILMFAGQEESIKRNIQKDKYWAKIHQTILSESNIMLTEQPLKRVMIGRRLLSTSSQCIRRVFFLSYAWRMTHDERYLKRAESELLAVSNFTDWNPSHFLDVAEMTLGVSIGYDWLYNNLSPSSRAIIKEAILKKGISPSLDNKNNGWLIRANNWNQVCNAGMSYGALAIYEDYPQLGASIINRAIKTIDVSMKEAYAPNGTYPEGYSYWSYGTSFNVLLISALDQLFGTDFGLSQKQGFLNTSVYLQNLTGPTGEAFNYSDCPPNWQPQPAMAWFAKKLKTPSLLYIERWQMDHNQDNLIKKQRLLPAFLIWGKDVSFEKSTAPIDKMYVGAGSNPVVMMRGSWTDPNALFVGLKMGTPSHSHAQMDIGSFVMESDGVRWAMDLGWQPYEQVESQKVDIWNFKQESQRWEVFRNNNFVHNTLTLNNSLQVVTGKAAVTSSSSTPLFMNATTNLSSMYKDLASANRGIAIVNNAYVVVKDEVETGDTEAIIRWVMLTKAKVSLNGKNKATLTHNGKKLQLQVGESVNVDIVTWSTTPLHIYDAPNPGTTLVGFEVKLPAHAKKDITVFLLPEKAIKLPKDKIKPLAQWPKE